MHLAAFILLKLLTVHTFCIIFTLSDSGVTGTPFVLSPFSDLTVINRYVGVYCHVETRQAKQPQSSVDFV